MNCHPDFPSYEIDFENGVVLFQNSPKQSLNNCGYFISRFKHIDGLYRTKSIHRFIYEAYNGEIPKDHEINHIDHNKQNNSITNLECLPRKEHRQKDRIGRIYKPVNKTPIRIKAINLENDEQILFDSIGKASKELQINQGMISYIIHGTHPSGHCNKARSKKDNCFYTFSKQ